jgi:hypothetical protein
MSDVVKECREILAMAGNSNRAACACSVKPVGDHKVQALVAQLNDIKQVGKTDYEAPSYKTGRLIIKPSAAWRKMVVLG